MNVLDFINYLDGASPIVLLYYPAVFIIALIVFSTPCVIAMRIIKKIKSKADKRFILSLRIYKIYHKKTIFSINCCWKRNSIMVT